MKKILLAALLPCLCFAFLAAQQPLPQKLNHLYGAIDKTKVPTGYLWNRSVCLASPENYSGVPNSFDANMDLFGMFYGALRNSYVGKEDNPLPAPSIYLDRIKTPPADGSVPLALMAMQFDRIRPDAHKNGLLRFEAGQVKEVPNQTMSPYFQDSIYVFAPLLSKAVGLEPVFNLPEALCFSNLGVLPTMDFDAGDGLGWRMLTPGGSIQAHYSASGSKVLRVRLQYRDRICYAAATIEVVPTDKRMGISERSGLLWPQNLYEAIPITASKPYMGAAGQATMHIFYNTSNCNTTKRMLRPLIVIEGYEEPGVTQSTFNRMFKLLDDVSWSGASGSNLTDEFYPYEYDLVYVDLNNGSDWIQRNAFVVEEVIKKVNEMKAAAGSVEQNVVIGVSMGGVAGKYALADMKTNGPAHDTRLFITYDSPLRGANIPIATQCLIKFMVDNLGEYAGTNISIPSIDAVWQAIQAPTPRQLLLNHVNTLPSVGMPNLQVAFLAELDALGALDMRHVALSNGSGTGGLGQSTMTPGFLFFDLTGQKIVCEEWPSGSGIVHCGDVNFDIELRATGNNTNTQVFYGFIEKNEPWPPSSQSTEWVVTMTSPPYDVAAGGTSNIGIGPLGTAPGGLISSLVSAGVALSGPGLTASLHCFIPAFSSVNASSPASWTAPQPCGNADRCTLSSTGNQIHVDLDSRIALVLIDELVTMSPPPVTHPLALSGNLNSYFNVGLPVYSPLPSVTISTNNGKLSINNAGRVAFAAPNDPVAPYNLLVADTKCKAIITVENAAQLVIGADLSTQHGQLNISDGSIVHIKTGGTLKVTSNNSMLMLRPGSKLILDPGAIVILENPESKIYIEGQLVVNGDFSFSGLGYFDFAGGPSQLVMGTGYSVFNLKGFSKTNRLARLSTSVFIPENKRLNWEKGLLEVAGGSMVANGTNTGVSFTNMTIRGNDASFDWALTTGHAGAQNFRYCDFSNLFKAVFMENSQPLLIENSTFGNIPYPVDGYGNSSVQIKSTTFKNYWEGVRWMQSGQAAFENVIFYGQQNAMAITLSDVLFGSIHGSYFSGHQDSNIGNNPTESQLEGAIPAIFVDNGIVVVSATTIENNTVGIKSLTLPAEDAQAAALLLVQSVVVSNNDAGIFMRGDETRGLVLADCAAFVNNRQGIVGSDITLMLDSQNSSIWSGDTDTPNAFVRDGDPHGGTTQDHVRVCYLNKSAPPSRLMRNNWWAIFDPGTNGTLFDPNPDPFISLFDNTCSKIAVMEVIEPRPQRLPEFCPVEMRPDDYGRNDGDTDCTTTVKTSDGQERSVNWQWHEGFYQLKTDLQAGMGVELLRPVADLWSRDLSNYGDNCQQYIASARAIVDGVDAAQQLDLRSKPSARKTNSDNARIGMTAVPNPAQEVTNINLPPNAIGLSLFDLHGKLIFHQKQPGRQVVVPVKNWNPGTYVACAQMEDGTVVTIKVAVIRGY